MISNLARPVVHGLETLRPLLDLGIRLYVANVFWKSGLSKIASFDTTVALFTDEYKVPLLTPELAAATAIVVELVFPVLLALGLSGRLAAGVLFGFNIIAVISYPDLNEIGIKDHRYWGILLLVPLLHGPGRLSIDHYLRKRWMR
jgi:putative oxidoreductase